MHTDIKYVNPNQNANDADALRDIVEYLKPSQWDVLVSATLHGKESCKQIAFVMSVLAGISGYPVIALIRTLRPDQFQDWYDNLEQC